jgi:tRNA A-37 threonylcarbamoyl transferase component Bud32
VVAGVERNRRETGSVKNGYPQLLSLKSGGVRWQVLPDCREVLLGPRGLRLQEWLDSGLAKIVKHGPHRTVYSVALPGLRFHLKHYRLNDTRSWIRQLLRPAKARREFERALSVAARNVPTIIPVGMGERCDRPGPNESFLITASLEDTESISAFVEKTLPGLETGRHARVRQRLARTLGEFMARLHEAGIAHNDLHAANVLVRFGAEDHLQLYLIDLHDVRLGTPLNWRATRRNLVMLNRWFALKANRTDRYRFWRAYCRARPSIPACGLRGLVQSIRINNAHCPPLTDLARELEDATWQSNLRFWRHRDRRCLETNRYYFRARSALAAGRLVRDLDPKEFQRLLEDPDAPFKEPGVNLLKASRSSTVARLELPVAGVPRGVIYKRFQVTSWHDPLTAFVRPSPALRSWIMGQGLRERFIPTARPLAVFHRRRHGFSFEAYLLTEEIAEAQDLHRLVKNLQRLPEKERRCQLRGRIEQIARLVYEVHRRNLTNRDLKASNILLTAESAWLIDLVGMQRWRRLSRSRRVQNLARLHVSFVHAPEITRTDKVRFLRIYLQWGLFGREGWKTWWREVEGATSKKIARNRRSGRPLG